jgi:hypothetical protein
LLAVIHIISFVGLLARWFVFPFFPFHPFRPQEAVWSIRFGSVGSVGLVGLVGSVDSVDSVYRIVWGLPPYAERAGDDSSGWGNI